MRSIFPIMFLLPFDLNLASCWNVLLISTGMICWEENTAHGSLHWLTVDLDRPPSALDDVGRHRQPESHPLAVLLGRKEGLKNQVEVFWRNPATRIGDVDTESTCLVSGFEPQRSTLWHGVLGIFDE